MSAHQRGEAGIKADLRLAVDRQQFPVAPKIFFPRGDFLAADRLTDAFVIVDDLQRSEAGFANMQGLLGIILPAFSTLKSLNKTHGSSFPCPIFRRCQSLPKLLQRFCRTRRSGGLGLPSRYEISFPWRHKSASGRSISRPRSRLDT